MVSKTRIIASSFSGAILAAFLLGNLAKFDVIPSVSFSLLDVVTASILLFAVLFKFSSLKTAFNHYKKLLILCILFALIGLFSLIIYSLNNLNLLEFAISFSYLIRWLMYVSSIIFLSQIINSSEARKLLYLILISVLSIGIIQYLFFPDIRILAEFDWDPHYYRLLGNFLDPGFLGIVIVLLLGYLLRHRLTIERVGLWLVAYVSLALTYSRASYLSFLVLMFLVSLQKKSWQLFAGVLILGAVTVWLLPRPGGEGVKLERTNSIAARIANWNQSLSIIKTHPLVGVGFNSYRYVQKDAGFLASNWASSHAGAGADSSILFATATTGVLGLFVFVFLLREIAHLQGTTIYLIPLLAHSLFLNSLFYPFVIFLMGLLILANQKSSKADTSK